MIRSLIFLSLLSCNTLFAQFEGLVESNNTTTDETGAVQHTVMKLWLKDGMARVVTTGDSSHPALIMIYRNDLKTVWVLNDEDKTYSEIAQNDAGEVPPPQKEDKPHIKRTGKTRTILGYRCEQMMITQGEAVTEIWGTKALASISSALSRALGEEPSGSETAWTDEVMRLGLFPLLAYTRIEGNVVESQEVDRIERKPLEAGLFRIPPDYRKQSVESLMK
jgi:hypothetical protein